MKKLEKEYQVGYDLGINLIDELGVLTKEYPNQNHIAGILSSIFNFAYYYAPNESVDKLIEFAKNHAKEQNLEESTDE